MLTILVVIALGYLLGSIPSGVWLGKALKGIDVREHGSKSTGATNVFRVLGAKIAIVVLVLDIAKGFLAAYAASGINLGDTLLTPSQLGMIAGVSAVIGHLLPLFAGFRGGKGVAAGAGILIFLAPLEVAFAAVIFGAALAITRYVSLSSILASLFFSLTIILERFLFQFPVGNEMVFLAIIIAFLIPYTHRANIRRLFDGLENKIGAKSK